MAYDYDYESFKKDVYKLTNINLDQYKERQMKRRIDSLIEKKLGQHSYEMFYRRMLSDKELLDHFIGYLTINVSEFYRNPGQWQMFEEEILQYVMSNNKGNIRVWSAACSTGDEPYTIAMIMLKHLPASRIKILATDLDEQVLDIAREGRYLRRSLLGLPKDMLNTYFEQDGDVYCVREEVKKLVEFRKHNLLEDRYANNLDIIVCRNVVIYFTEEAKNEVYEKFHKSLNNNGMLFIGNTEQIIKAKEIGFETYKSFFYKKI